jgi:hypothetical protein
MAGVWILALMNICAVAKKKNLKIILYIVKKKYFFRTSSIVTELNSQ